jgi:hypothetical protein
MEYMDVISGVWYVELKFAQTSPPPSYQNANRTKPKAHHNITGPASKEFMTPRQINTNQSSNPFG